MHTVKYIIFCMYSEGIPFAVTGWLVHLESLFHKVSVDAHRLL